MGFQDIISVSFELSRFLTEMLGFPASCYAEYPFGVKVAN